MSATYLYGVVDGEHSLTLGHIGLPDGSARVDAIPIAGLTAIVSEYDGPPFREMPKEGVLRLLINHQQVLERVIEKYALLPARFGTMLASPDDVRQALARFGSRLHEALRDVGGAIEVDLSGTWDLPEVLAEIGSMPDLAQAAGTAADETPDEALAFRLRIGRLVQERVEQRRDELRRAVVTDLVRLARDAQPNPRPSEDVVFNIAFLVDREEVPAFDAAIERVWESLSTRLRLRYVGPLPPYSFGTVVVTRPEPARVRAAADLLGLRSSMTRAELRDAYRKAAARLHPDINQQDQHAEAKFAEVTDAHAELARYLDGVSGDTRKADDAEFDLSEGALRSAFLLQIAREAPLVGEELETRYESPIST